MSSESKLGVQFFSNSETDEMSAELLADGVEFGHLVQRGSGWLLSIYQNEGDALELSLEEFLQVLQSAKLGLRNRE